jgi:hypothetical protein
VNEKENEKTIGGKRSDEVMGVKNASNKVRYQFPREGVASQEKKFVRISRFLRSNINDSRNKVLIHTL